MIKVLIVDDEKPVLEGLKVLIKRHVPQAIVIGTARSGREAIEMTRAESPDLVLIDVKMPGMTGLEAIVEMKKIDPKTRYILITAYERFDIAHKAFEIGVQDYLLKPVTKDRLLQVIDRYISLIEETKNSEGSYVSVNSIIEECRDLLETNFFNIFKSRISYDGFRFSQVLGQQGRIHNLPEDGGRFVVIESANIGGERNTFRELFTYKSHGLVSYDGINRLNVFVPSPESDDEQGLKELCINIAKQAVPRSDEITVLVGPKESFFALDEAWNKTQETWNAQYKLKRDQGQSSESQWPWQIERDLVVSLIHGDEERFQNELDEMLNFLQGRNLRDYESISTVLLHALGRKMCEENIDPVKLHLPEFAKNDKADELREKFIPWALELAMWWRSTNPGKLSPIVSKTRDYVIQNYRAQLSLDDLASYVGVTPHYLSRIFSDEMNESFVDFLTRIRMKKARELLRAGSSIKSCCAEVGYLDPNYFSRLFKKCNGVTPREYVRIKE